MRIETVTKTVVLPLETSQRKNERVREAIAEWQRIAGHMADRMPSIESSHWRAKDTTLSRVVKNTFPDHGLRWHDAYQAAYKVGEAFGSWDSNGRGEAQPQFGDGDYYRVCNCGGSGVVIESNDRGYGVRVAVEPRKPEWWHVTGGDYQREYLERIIDGELAVGSGEMHLTDDGVLSLHLSVSEDIDVCEWGELTHTVGVDLGERCMYAAAVTAGNDVKEVTIESGREYRHHRERMKRKRDRLQHQGKLRQRKQVRNQYHDYTDHITHLASHDIVSLAAKYERAGIVLEDLSHYRETATDPIHDWPYAELQTKILYKATERGIPVDKSDAAGTSTTCRKCGHENTANREGDEFHCVQCGYEVHADVNAAINIAAR